MRTKKVRRAFISVFDVVFAIITKIMRTVIITAVCVAATTTIMILLIAHALSR